MGCSGVTCDGGNCICKVVAPCQSCSEATCVCESKGWPFAVDGRILSSSKAGDSSDWIEIARYKQYSLIVRMNHLQINNSSGPEHTKYALADTNDYSNSIVRSKINNWFNGSATNSADGLSDNARLRSFSVNSNAASALGTGTKSLAGANDSFSLPRGELSPYGTDIAFALSYSEAANFISDYYQYGGGVSVQSPEVAKTNFKNCNCKKYS